MPHDPRKDVIAACQRMNRMGLNQGTSGNVSVRTEAGFLITCSGVPYDAITPEHVVPMDLDGTYTGDVLPSSEWHMHLEIYRTRPEAGAVIHAHSAHATALSCLRQDIPAFHYMIAVAGGDSLRCADYHRFGTRALSQAMLKALKDRNACLLANHGMICFGRDLDHALYIASEVETLCHQYVIACQCGTPVILSDADMQDVLDRFATYGQQPADLAPDATPAFDLPQKRDG